MTFFILFQASSPKICFAILYYIACLYFIFIFYNCEVGIPLADNCYSSNMNVDDIIGLAMLAVVVVLFLGVSFVFWSCPAPKLCGKNLIQAPKADPSFKTLV